MKLHNFQSQNAVCYKQQYSPNCHCIFFLPLIIQVNLPYNVPVPTKTNANEIWASDVLLQI